MQLTLTTRFCGALVALGDVTQGIREGGARLIESSEMIPGFYAEVCSEDALVKAFEEEEEAVRAALQVNREGRVLLQGAVSRAWFLCQRDVRRWPSVDAFFAELREKGELSTY